MNKKIKHVDKPVIETILESKFNEFEERIEQKFVTKNFLSEQFEKFGREVDEKARGYRDDVLNKMDEVIGELSQIREDQIFTNHDLKDH